jgi:hypothetical protein
MLQLVDERGEANIIAMEVGCADGGVALETESEGEGGVTVAYHELAVLVDREVLQRGHSIIN